MKDEILINEFILRKQQVLNLEMRLFILLFVIEIVFVFFFAIKPLIAIEKRYFFLIGFSVFTIFLLEMIAINGKMGLTSMYLRQMEEYLTSLGYTGAVWESKAIEKIIFTKFNAFTTPSILVILLLFFQTIYITYITVSAFISIIHWKYILTIIICGLFLFILIKAITVDFNKSYPVVFPHSQDEIHNK